MYIPKRYGESKIELCPFCKKQSITTNSQGVPVCLNHKHSEIPALKCACGEYLDIKKGKYGPFFICMNCGCISWNKAMEINPDFSRPNAEKAPQQIKTQVQQKAPQFYQAKKENKSMTIKSSELDFYYN